MRTEKGDGGSHAPRDAFPHGYADTNTDADGRAHSGGHPGAHACRDRHAGARDSRARRVPKPRARTLIPRMEKEPRFPPGIHEISRETTPVQEEFIQPEATPSRDLHDRPCPRCGKPRKQWDGEGATRMEVLYCSEECAEPPPGICD
ncbi:MAG: hypothetical protein PHQ12_01005 [Chthoniobacteraceae bacterium]|nr:hypothetical protein [Chthoniobacteraceae bacterium]